MAVRTKTQFKALYGSAGTLFPDNTTAEISEADVRAFGEDGADSVPFTADDSFTWPFPQLTASGTDSYTGTLSPAPSNYSTAMKVQIRFTNANTGAATIDLNGFGGKAIVKNGSVALVAGDIAAGQILLLAYDGTNFQIMGGGGGGGAGTVTSVTGTTSRIDVDLTNPAVPVIDIDAAYDAAIVAAAVAAVPDADATTKGIAKLYTVTGSNTDGSMDQNSITVLFTDNDFALLSSLRAFYNY